MRPATLAAAILALGGLLVWLLWFWEPAPSPVGVVGANPNPSPVETGGAMHSPLALAQAPGGGDFVLDSWQGPVDTRDLRGSVVLIYFGYTWCPDICPTNLAFVANAIGALRPEEQERVQVLFVGVDPQRDTLQRLREYGDYFHPRVQGLTGTPEELAKVAGLYGAAYRRAEGDGSALGYTVDHSAYTYVLNPTGRLVGTLDHATPPAEIVAAIRAALAGG